MRSFSVLEENYANKSDKSLIKFCKFTSMQNAKGCLFVSMRNYQTGANFAPVDFEIS